MRDKSKKVVLILLIIILAVISGLSILDFRSAIVRERKEYRQASDLRSLQVAIESYFVEHRAYPAWATGKDGQNGFLPPDDPAFSVPTFAIRNAERPNLATLTTPVAYLDKMIADPFAKHRAGYAYWAGDCKQKWIVYSPGRDGTYEIDPQEDYGTPEDTPCPALIQKTYDPTNGFNSAGDLYRYQF